MVRGRRQKGRCWSLGKPNCHDFDGKTSSHLHAACGYGDFVIVTNVEQIEFSGNKWKNKTYARYSGYPGLKLETAESLRKRLPERVLRESVRRMLPAINGS